MSSYQTRKKIVAYEITSFLAFGLAALGAALGYSGLADRNFLEHGDREALAICLKDLTMHCDPRRWWVTAIVGAVFLVLGLVFLVRLVTKLRRLLRKGPGR
jgi:TRAP-type C4-dicarboxylate transport system permease small subunit